MYLVLAEDGDVDRRLAHTQREVVLPGDVGLRLRRRCQLILALVPTTGVAACLAHLVAAGARAAASEGRRAVLRALLLPRRIRRRINKIMSDCILKIIRILHIILLKDCMRRPEVSRCE
jgi:hypothetical protein